MQKEQFERVNSLEEATHWIPTYDKRFRRYDYFKGLYKLVINMFYGDPYNIDTRVILGKPYLLFESPSDQEICIYDETGVEIPLWIAHEGYFVKETLHRKEMK